MLLTLCFIDGTGHPLALVFNQ